MGRTYYAKESCEPNPEKEFEELETFLDELDAEKTKLLQTGLGKGKELRYFSEEIQQRARE